MARQSKPVMCQHRITKLESRHDGGLLIEPVLAPTVDTLRNFFVMPSPEIRARMQMILPCEKAAHGSGKVANSQPVIQPTPQWVTLSNPSSREDCGLTQVDSLQQALKTG